MASPLGLAFDALVTLFEGLTPPDRTETPYRLMTRSAGKSHEREFWFSLPVNVETTGQQDVGVTSELWEFDVFVRIGAHGRENLELAKLVADEQALLKGAIKRISTKPAGVRYFRLVSSDVIEDEESQNAILVLNFDAQTEETD